MTKPNEKNNFVQILKFMLVSCAAGVLQLVLANLLPLLFDGITATIPSILQPLFNPDTLFNVNTLKGAMDYAKYVVNGVVTWGYVIPFFLSNLLANIYGYFQNRKTTFKSDAPAINFVYYFFILVVLILITTWLQGQIVGRLNSSGISLLVLLSRTIAAAVAGLVQFAILFPLEKFVLFRDTSKDNIKAETDVNEGSTVNSEQ